MKKLTRIACLVTALVLVGFANAGAQQWDGYVYCYYSCGETVITWAGECCGTQYTCSNGNWGVALWEPGRVKIYCEI